MNLLDILILVWAVLAGVSGYRRGASLQIIEYLGLFAGLFAGALLAPKVAPLASSPLMQSVLALGILLGLAALGEGLGWIVGRRVWAAARQSVLGPLDAAGGSVVSILAVLLTVWFFAYNLVNGPVPALSREVRSSAIVQGLGDALPRPPSVLSQARQFLDRFGFPEVFAGLPPEPAGPVTTPSNRATRALAAKVEDSTVRIEGQACGLIEEGSGFVVATHYVVTNAHVVAGVAAPVVQEPATGRSQPATTVLFDPKVDLAVLYVRSSPGPPLPLDDTTRPRGAAGMVIGYPGGGSLAYGSAAVRRELLAVGRDIYGNSIVERHVYELQAVVRPGNSGGPFVLASGAVGGVVFAASTTDENVGYALTAGEVMPDIRRAQGLTRPVSDEGCTR